MALAIGCFVNDIDTLMGASEFLSWQAYYAEEPFGQERDNFHAGVIASTIANAHSKRTFKPNDFMLKSERQKREENLKTFIAGLRAYAKPKKDSTCDAAKSESGAPHGGHDADLSEI